MKSSHSLRILSTATFAMTLIVALAGSARAVSIIHHWEFEETSGLSAADSVGGLTGTLTKFEENDNSQWVAGKIGGALDNANGATVNNSVAMPAGLTAVNNTTGYTVSAWMKLNATSSVEQNIFISAGTGTAEVNIGHKNAAMSAFNNPFDSGGTISTGVWQHIVLTNSTATGKDMYINGSSVFAGSAGSNAWTNSVISSIGAHVDTNQRFIDGLIDDVSLWSRVLTAAETNALYNFADTGVLNYDAGEADQLIDLNAGSVSSVALDGLLWTRVTDNSLTGGLGEVDGTGSDFFVNFGSGNGIQSQALPSGTAPEPSTIVLAVLGLVGLAVGRSRRKRG